MGDSALTSDLTIDRAARRLLVRGSPVDAVTFDDTLASIGHMVGAKTRAYVCLANVHVLMEARLDRRLHEALIGAGLVVPEGMPLVWLMRIAGFSLPDRVYGPALFESALAGSSESRWRHYLFGGRDGTGVKLAQAIRQRWPATEIVGFEEPVDEPPGYREPTEVVDRINRSGADIVWVGLGAPKQEIWMANHRASLEAPVLIGVGQAFDLLAGRRRWAPQWMQRRGLEWLFRLGNDPRRLWRRYFLHNPVFLLILIRAYAAIRSRDPERASRARGGQG